MKKFKQRLLLKKVEKLLQMPAPPPENYDSTTTMDTMYIGATAPRTAGHFADGNVSVRQGLVKRIAGVVLEVLGGGEVEAKLVEIEVKFQELDLELLFTAREEGERMAVVAGRRKDRRGPAPSVSEAELEVMKSRIERWQKEQLLWKRRLYKIEDTVRDLGVNVNDPRCRALEQDRRRALDGWMACTDEGVRVLRGVVGELGGG